METALFYIHRELLIFSGIGLELALLSLIYKSKNL